MADGRQGRPGPEVPRRRRRSFTAEYKLQILAAYDAAEPGEKAGILRREGLYSSHIVEWRRARDAGAIAALGRPRGRPATDPRSAQIAQLSRWNAKLEQELANARFVVDVQAKLYALLRARSGDADTDPTLTT
jgi:transposase-like protein